MTEETRQQIRGALARGYCTKENETKVLDPELIEAMAQEVDALLNQALQAQRERLVSEIEKKYLNQDEYEERAMFFQLGNNRAIDEILNLINPPNN